MIALTAPNIRCNTCRETLNRVAYIPENMNFILTRNKCHHCNNVVEVPIWRVK